MHISLTLPNDEFKSWQQTMGKKPQVNFIGILHGLSLKCMHLHCSTKWFMYFLLVAQINFCITVISYF